VTPGVQYYFTVTATNAGGGSINASSELPAMAIAAIPAAVPVITKGVTSVVVTWPAIAGATGYDILYGAATGVYTNTISNVLSGQTVVGLPYGTGATSNLYYFKIRAKNANGSILSGEISSAVFPIPPLKPTAIALLAPTLATDIENRPTFHISGINSGNTVNIFTDSACTILAGTAVSVATTADVQLTSALPYSTTRPRAFTYYANQVWPASLGGGASVCSTVSATYNYYPCQTGFVPVPANAALAVPAFCVMQFEAKNSGNGTTAASVSVGLPWTNVTATQAKTYCNNINATTARNYDLISNPEWMTIARNVEAVAANWHAGVAGVTTEYMWNGNYSASASLCARVDGSLSVSNSADPYDQTCASAAANPQAQRRHTLSNGSQVWDMAGNVGEIVDWSINRSPVGTIAAYSAVTPAASCPTVSTLAENYKALSACGLALTQTLIQPTLNTNAYTQRYGQFFGGKSNVTIRGGSYTSTDFTSGIYALDMFGIPPLANVGFRCVDRP
jgi:hypothetical protein